MTASRKLNKTKREPKKGGTPNQLSMPRCMSRIFRRLCLSLRAQDGEASEESGEIIKGPDNSPAIAQGSTSLEPLAGELLGDAPGATEVAPRPFGPKRMQSQNTPISCSKLQFNDKLVQ